QGLHPDGGGQGGLGQRAARHAQLALCQSRVSEGRTLRQADTGLDRLGRSQSSDGQAGALRWRTIRRHPPVPGYRHHGRPAVLGRARRLDHGRRRLGRRAILNRAGDEAGRLHQVTAETRALGRLLLSPAVGLLFVWMIVPLAMTIYFSTLRYNLLNPGMEQFVGLENYIYFLSDPAFLASLRNTLVLVGAVL